MLLTRFFNNEGVGKVQKTTEEASLEPQYLTKTSIFKFDKHDYEHQSLKAS